MFAIDQLNKNQAKYLKAKQKKFFDNYLIEKSFINHRGTHALAKLLILMHAHAHGQTKIKGTTLTLPLITPTLRLSYLTTIYTHGAFNYYFLKKMLALSMESPLYRSNGRLKLDPEPAYSQMLKCLAAFTTRTKSLVLAHLSSSSFQIDFWFKRDVSYMVLFDPLFELMPWQREVYVYTQYPKLVELVSDVGTYRDLAEAIRLHNKYDMLPANGIWTRDSTAPNGLKLINTDRVPDLKKDELPSREVISDMYRWSNFPRQRASAKRRR